MSTDSADPGRHLRRASGRAGVRPLSVPTGMARMAIEERILGPGERKRIAGPAAAEGFVFVLAGSGEADAGGSTQPVTARDFLALTPGETLTVHNTGGEPLAVLIGFSEGGADALAP